MGTKSKEQNKKHQAAIRAGTQAKLDKLLEGLELLKKIAKKLGVE